MGLEIERRFLLKNDRWREYVRETRTLHQGYLSVEKERSIRVRITQGQAWLTLKGFISDVSRSEFEYPVPVEDAQAILETMCVFKVEKIRHIVEYQGIRFEIDEFAGSNAPLVLAELELPSEDARYPQPDWLGEEVTSDGRFTNAYLSKHPYASWK